MAVAAAATAATADLFSRLNVSEKSFGLALSAMTCMRFLQVLMGTGWLRRTSMQKADHDAIPTMLVNLQRST
jgi:hypothetical protein